MFEMQLHSEKETMNFAKQFAQGLEGGECIGLSGDLGAGKTVFVKGLAEGLGISDLILSPTFPIVRGYQGKNFLLNHFDVYRVDDPDEMFEIGFDEYLNNGGITVIEWYQKIQEVLPEKVILIFLESIGGENRMLRMEKGEKILKRAGLL